MDIARLKNVLQPLERNRTSQTRGSRLTSISPQARSKIRRTQRDSARTTHARTTHARLAHRSQKQDFSFSFVRFCRQTLLDHLSAIRQLIILLTFYSSRRSAYSFSFVCVCVSLLIFTSTLLIDSHLAQCCHQRKRKAFCPWSSNRPIPTVDLHIMHIRSLYD